MDDSEKALKLYGYELFRRKHAKHSAFPLLSWEKIRVEQHMEGEWRYSSLTYGGGPSMVIKFHGSAGKARWTEKVVIEQGEQFASLLQELLQIDLSR